MLLGHSFSKWIRNIFYCMYFLHSYITSSNNFRNDIIAVFHVFGFLVSPGFLSLSYSTIIVAINEYNRLYSRNRSQLCDKLLNLNCFFRCIWYCYIFGFCSTISSRTLFGTLPTNSSSIICKHKLICGFPIINIWLEIWISKIFKFQLIFSIS